MKAILLLAMVFAAACVSAATGAELTAAKDYAVKTYADTDNAKYKDFSYSEAYISDTSKNVTIKFTRVSDTPSYVLTTTLEQVVTIEKKGSEHVVTATSPTRVLTQSYSYK